MQQKCKDDSNQYSQVADFYHNRGICLRKLCRYEDAIADYTVALEYGSHQTKSLQNRAYCYEKLGSFKQALNDYKTIIDMKDSLNINSPSLNNGKFGEGSNSSSYINKPLVIKSIVSAYVSRGNLFETMNQFNDAVNDYTSGLELIDNERSIRNLMNDNNKSKDIFLSLSITLLTLRSKLYQKLGQFSNAIDDFTILIDLNPNDRFSLLFNRGICFKATEHFQQAISDLSQILENDRLNYVVFMHRAYCYRKLDLYENSILDYSNAIELTSSANIDNSTCIKAYNHRGFCYGKITLIFQYSTYHFVM